MKTYEEMTESVLQRAKAGIAERKNRRKRIFGAVLSGLCAVMVLTAVGMAFKMHTIDPENGMADGPVKTPEEVTEGSAQPGSAKVTFLHGTAMETMQKDLAANVKIPINFMLRVRDVRKMSKSQIAKEIREEIEFVNNFRENWQGESGYQGYQGDTAIITLIYNGFLCIEVDDYNQVQSTAVKTTDAGSAVLNPYFYKVSAGDTESEDWEVKRGFQIYWSLSSQVLDMLEEDPQIPLSSISDTITVEITYKDRPPETVAIDLTVDNDGQIYVMRRGSVADA